MKHDIFTTENPSAGTRDNRAGTRRLATEEESRSWKHYGTWTGSRNSAICQAITLVNVVGSANARVFTCPKRGLGSLVYTVKTECAESRESVLYGQRDYEFGEDSEL